MTEAPRDGERSSTDETNKDGLGMTQRKSQESRGQQNRRRTGHKAQNTALTSQRAVHIARITMSSAKSAKIGTMDNNKLTASILVQQLPSRDR
jgi:hypothetical protein